jgi:D-methionine transport system substrate-binding protein
MKKKLLASLAVVPLLVALAGCSASAGAADSSHSASAAPVTVKLGVSDSSQDYWPILLKEAKQHGIDIQLVNFSDYSQPNPALVQKQIDLSLFEHLQFLGTYNVQAHEDLVPIGATIINPLSLYSDKYKSVKDIPKGTTIAVPNDPANLARGLNVLASVGLIKFKDKVSQPTQADIDTSTSKVQVALVDAATTVNQLSSLGGAVVNNNYAQAANIDPNSAIAKDNPKSPSAQPYINTFVARPEDKNNKTFAEIVKLYRSPAVMKAVLAASKGTSVEVNNVSNAQLETILKKVEAGIKAGQ